ncbi:MAG: DUF2845 domain-containing protein [Deltaproteobacteria bacterium]|jgi:hypothetical protein
MGKRSFGLLLAVVLLTLTMAAVPALAQMGQSVLGPVRCGTKLIQAGKDTQSSVLAKCGEPTTRNPGRRGGGQVWTYNRGAGKFMGILRFTGPNLTAIERSEYGFAQPTQYAD